MSKLTDTDYYDLERQHEDLQGDYAQLLKDNAKRLELLRRAYMEMKRVRDFVDYEPFELMDEIREELGE